MSKCLCWSVPAQTLKCNCTEEHQMFGAKQRDNLLRDALELYHNLQSVNYGENQRGWSWKVIFSKHRIMLPILTAAKVLLSASSEINCKICNVPFTRAILYIAVYSLKAFGFLLSGKLPAGPSNFNFKIQQLTLCEKNLQPSAPVKAAREGWRGK